MGARQVSADRAGPAAPGHTLPEEGATSPSRGDERGTELCAGSFPGAQAVRQASPGGVLLANAGGDPAHVYREAQDKFLPMIRIKGGEAIKDGHGKAVRKAFREVTYRPCAVGESFLGP